MGHEGRRVTLAFFVIRTGFAGPEGFAGGGIEEGFMSRPIALLMVVLAVVIAFVPEVQAHFGLVLPSDDIVTQDDSKTVALEVKFIHPMEMHYMEMEKPKRFGVFHKGKTEDLGGSLEKSRGRGGEQQESFTFWKAQYVIKRPGDYTFFVEPTPYWEPAENKFIVHLTKVCVHALGLEEGWDEPVGLEMEIIPMTRPYGLWTGNVFTGQVLHKGKPVPNAEVEVEYLNESPDNPSVVKVPSDPFVTQVVKADRNGVFSYAMPRAGWWGFAALKDATWKLKKEGKPRDVELGAVFWVRTVDMK